MRITSNGDASPSSRANAADRPHQARTHSNSKRSVEAQQRLLQAQTAGSSWLEPLEQAADGLLQETAELLILAHQRCQEAHGVNRAVGLARRNEVWTPESAERTTDWLIAAGEEDRVRRAGGVA